jgi:hypothetical protein
MEDVKEAMTVLQKEQNAGVALLLERMKTNPEEFTQDHKWMGVIRSYKEYLSEEDRKVLDAGINELMQQKFTECILEGLVDPKPLTNLEQLLQAKQNATLSAGQTPVRSSVTLNNTNAVGTWGDSTLKQALATLEEIKKEYEPKQHKTLFGRLFNYS